MNKSTLIIIALAFVTGSALAIPSVSMYGGTMNEDISDISADNLDKSDGCLCRFSKDAFPYGYLCKDLFPGAECRDCRQTQEERYIVDPETGYVYANTFGNGTVIPEDYVDPVHGADSVSDPRNRVLYRPWPTQALPPIPAREDAEIQERLDYYNIPIPTWSGSINNGVRITITDRLSQFL